jgi:hypothetical protein
MSSIKVGDLMSTTELMCGPWLNPAAVPSPKVFPLSTTLDDTDGFSSPCTTQMSSTSVPADSSSSSEDELVVSRWGMGVLLLLCGPSLPLWRLVELIIGDTNAGLIFDAATTDDELSLDVCPEIRPRMITSWPKRTTHRYIFRYVSVEDKVGSKPWTRKDLFGKRF